MSAARKKDRRPPAFSEGLVVLTESLYGGYADDNAALNCSAAETEHNSGESEEDEPDEVTGEPLPLSLLQKVKLGSVYQPAWRIHNELEAQYPRQRRFRGGRHRECLFIEVILVLIAKWLLQEASERELFRNFEDPEFWTPVAKAVETAYPDDPTRRLRAKPLSRKQFYRWRNVVAAHPDYKRLIDDFDKIAADAALEVQQFPSNAPVTHPQTVNALTSDGKLVGALYKARIDQAIDPVTGEKLRRYDPDALQYTVSHENRIEGDPDDPDSESRSTWIRQAGYHIVHVSSRSPVKGIRIPLSIRLLDKPDAEDKKGECSLAVDMAVEIDRYITSKGGEVSAFTYDGGMYTNHRSRLLDHGIIPIGRIQRDKNDAYAERDLGNLTFKLRDGSKKEIAATAVDGTPSIQSRLADGREITVGLVRKKLQWDPQAERMVLLGIWEIPDLPGVPKTLRKARTIIQHNNTRDDFKSGSLRTRALAVITENDPDFRPMFGHRQDSESLNADLEGRLNDGRATAVTRRRFQLDLTGYQQSWCIRALAHYMIENNIKKLPEWFGEHELPDSVIKSELTDEP